MGDYSSGSFQDGYQQGCADALDDLPENAHLLAEMGSDWTGGYRAGFADGKDPAA